MRTRAEDGPDGAGPRTRMSVPVAVAVLFAFAGPGGAAAQDSPIPDTKGGKDHPAISRYAGSALIGYRYQKFGELVIPLGPVKAVGAGGKATREFRASGETTRLLYVAPVSRSALEVARNYEQELSRAGFQTLHSCAEAECGDFNGRALIERHLYRAGQRLHYGAGTTDFADSAFASLVQSVRYFVAQRSAPDGDTFVSVLVGVQDLVWPRQLQGRTLALVDVVTTARMDSGMVTVDAAAMTSEIARTGHVALYGIHFDTDKALVKPGSEPTLQEIAKVMKQDPRMKLYVVGHTDGGGSFEHNLALADRRAAAVVAELTSRHGVAAARLRAFGAGPIAPVAPNTTEDGRTRNRRVELVVQ